MNIKIVHTLTDSNGTRAVLEAANTLTTHVRRPDFPAKDNGKIINNKIQLYQVPVKITCIAAIANNNRLIHLPSLTTTGSCS